MSESADPFDQPSPVRLSFLDGLRGWGAVFVLLNHVFCDGFPLDDVVSPLLGKFVAFNGTMAVYIFFVVSGFSLSFRYLRSGEWQGLAKIAVGRYPRLVIPIFAACLFVHLTIVTGILDQSSPRLPRFDGFMKFDPTLQHLLSFGLWDVFFSFDFGQTYIPPLWTMPVELFGSGLVLLLIFVLHRWPGRVWLLAACAIAFVSLAPTPNAALLGLFPAGAVLADAYGRGWIARIPSWIGIVCIAIGCVIPFAFASSPVAWGLNGACLLTLGCIVTPYVKGILSGPLSRELGRLSFPLYLMHAPVFWIVGEPLVRSAGQDVASHLVINFLIVLLSVGAGYCFIPVNSFAIGISRSFAGSLVDRLRPFVKGRRLQETELR